MKRHLIPTLAAAALLLVPTIALAENDQNSQNNGNPNGWYNQQGQWQQGQQQNGRRHHDGDHRNRNGQNRRDDDDERGNNGNHYGWNNPHNPHSYNNGGYNNGGYGRNGNYGGGYGGYGNNGNRIGGQVSSFSPYNLYLSNGTHVELHDGTVINPTGATPQPGQSVTVIGHWNADRTFAADEIDLR